MKAILGAQLRRAALVVVGLVASLTVSAAETFEYIHTDALGSPVAVTDANGVVIERMVYEPYGALVGGPVKDGPGYTGHVSDSATGLSYMQQRYMDPEIGAFLSVDPAVTLDKPTELFGRYRYANSNPYRYSDPDGRCAVATGSRVCGGGGSSKLDIVFVNPSSSGNVSTQSATSEQSLRSTPQQGLGQSAGSSLDGNEAGSQNELVEDIVELSGAMYAGGKKYQTPANPNKRPPPPHRAKTGDRERNVKHPDGEEHSRRPKGGFRVRVPLILCFICNIHESYLEQTEPPSDWNHEA